MAASNTDKITDVRNAARPNSARVSSGRSAGGATLACDNLTGWPTASKVHFVTYEIDSNSNPVAGTQLDCYGIRSGNNITSLVVVDGTDAGNLVNDVVEMLPTAAWGQDLADALTNQHSRTGAHLAVNNTGGLTTDTLTVSGISTQTGAVTHTGATTLTGAVGGAGYSLATIVNPANFTAYLTGNQTISANTWTKIGINTKTTDTGSNFNTTTNQFTAAVAGTYIFIGTINATNLATTGEVAIGINVNAFSSTPTYVGGQIWSGANTVNNAITMTKKLILAVNDTVQLYGFSGSTGILAGSANTYFEGCLVSS